VWTVEPADEQAAEAKKKENSEDEDTMTNETVKPHSPNEAFVPQSVGAFCFSKLTISDLYITYALAFVGPLTRTHARTHTTVE